MVKIGDQNCNEVPFQTLFFLFKLGIQLRDRLIREVQSHLPLVELHLKLETNPPKSTPEEIESKTLNETQSKVRSLFLIFRIQKNVIQSKLYKLTFYISKEAPL